MPKIPINGSDLFIICDEEDHLALILAGPFCLVGGNEGKRYPATTSHQKHKMADYVHHIVARRMGLVHPETVDHENRNRCDARRQNLRAATRSENGINRGIDRTSSGHKYIVWNESKKKWQVLIRRQSFYKWLGRWSTLEQAIKIRDSFLKANPQLQVGDLQ